MYFVLFSFRGYALAPRLDCWRGKSGHHRAGFLVKAGAVMV